MDAEHEAMKREAERQREQEALATLEWENSERKKRGLPPLPKKPFWKR